MSKTDSIPLPAADGQGAANHRRREDADPHADEVVETRERARHLGFEEVDGEYTTEAVVGESRTFAVAAREDARLEILDPDGTRRTFDASNARNDRIRVPIEQRGLHRVFAIEGEQRRSLDQQHFAANLPPAESALRRDGVADKIRTLRASVGESSLRGQERRVELWPILLFIVLIRLYLESLVGFRRRFLKRLVPKLPSQPTS